MYSSCKLLGSFSDERVLQKTRPCKPVLWNLPNHNNCHPPFACKISMYWACLRWSTYNFMGHKMLRRSSGQTLLSRPFKKLLKFGLMLSGYFTGSCSTIQRLLELFSSCVAEEKKARQKTESVLTTWKPKPYIRRGMLGYEGEGHPYLHNVANKSVYWICVEWWLSHIQLIPGPIQIELDTLNQHEYFTHFQNPLYKNYVNQSCEGTLVSNFFTYSMTPRDHKSAVWLYGCSRTSSGAMYNGVPERRNCINFSPQTIKSPVFITPRKTNIIVLERTRTKVVSAHNSLLWRSMVKPLMDRSTIVLQDIALANPKSQSWNKPPKSKCKPLSTPSLHGRSTSKKSCCFRKEVCLSAFHTWKRTLCSAFFTLTMPPAPMRIFCGFMSLWMIRWEWR